MWIARRRVCASFALATAATLFACSEGAPDSTPTAAPAAVVPAAIAPPARGRLLVSGGGNFHAVDLATRQVDQVSHFPPKTFAASPALSPDRKRLAYTYFVVSTDPNNLGGADLYVADVDLSNSHLVLSDKQNNGSFENPCWTADGKALDVIWRIPQATTGRNTDDIVGLYRIALDGSAPVKLADRALSPTISADGTSLAYVNSTTWGLWVADADVRRPREVFDAAYFEGVRSPRFAPDGKRLVFTAALRTGAPTPVSASAGSSLRALFEVAIAEADHGAPWELWSIRPDGHELRQMTHLLERTPSLAWSPDGRWLALDGANGLSLVDSATGQAVRLVSTVFGGGIVWLS